ncbi:non-ribosomal peptide synthetase [Planomonospora parontospora]|uniref:non-ribosomal peptide synthetase n=1 Tax=Planomonospora parontospora TaxID=58119 RepID=UPI00166FCB15|nr:non-ribosomal peptide synthetase [Planomonospora parontospora]GGL43133.1 hypothetical protein GCM10014719_50570 [Planomonospora parontospora subsp. antibiotica]
MFELSASQQIVWLHEEMLPGSRAYNFTATLDLRGTLDETALRAGLAAVVDRHPGLRLELVAGSGNPPMQRVRENCAPRYRTEDLSGAADPEAAFAALLRAEAERPLDTCRAPLLRWCLVRLADDHHRLIHVEHHLIHDGHSFAILLEDVFTVYGARVRGEQVSLPEARSYAEHVRAAAARDRGRSLAYWAGELHGATFDLPLPGLVRPGAVRRHNGGQIRRSIDAGLAERLRAHAQAAGHTPFSTLLGLFAELMRRHSGRTDLVVGTAVGNRPQGFEQTLGMFVNTIPLRLRLDPAATATEAVDEVTDTLIRALPHQEVPVQELTSALGLHTGGADNPLFSVMFSAHDAALPQTGTPGLEVSLYEGFNTGTTRFDLDLVLLPDDRRGVGPRRGPAGMTLVWDYDADLFEEETVHLLADRFAALVEAYADAPADRLGALAAAPAHPGRACAPVSEEVLDVLAGRDPARPAVVSGAERLTYGELERRVAELADRLERSGVGAGQPVAAVLPRGLDSVVALLACLRTGAVYCPLSPDDPPARLEALLGGLGPALVLATAQTALSLPAHSPPPALLDRAGFPAAVPARRFDGAAYIIHTSGSTGVPKPVLVGRAALANHVSAVVERYGLVADDRVLLFAQPAFDVALEEMLASLAAGACLTAPQVDVPAGTELVAVLAARRVTVANLPTGYFLAVRDELGQALRDGRWSPRLIVLGGERLPADAVAGLLDDLESTGAALVNAYGVTEAAITSTAHTVTRGDLAAGAEIPLGTELAGVRVHVLDAGLRPLPAGAVGELAIGGSGLADGYVGEEAATAARFVRACGERVYLTGDLGYRDAAGRLWFLGRRDNQVKLRGHRIELEEIEVAASAELGGRPCAVVAVRNAPAGPHLVGFVQSPVPVDQRELHLALSRRLPAALVPGRWVRLEAMPTLPGGKPDRAALARTAGELPQTDRDAAAEAGDPAVAVLMEGWKDVLGHDRLSPDSHFFQVGGHSLLAAQLAAWLESRLGHRPPLRLLFQNPVLADQARALAQAAQAPEVPA